jgi:cysteine synthase A
VPVISVPQAFNEEELYVDLRPIFGHRLYLKCEGFNFAGSVKLKTATAMVEAAERDGLLAPGSILVESSSGNLGVALSVIAASKGYRFLCVTDPRCNLSARLLIKALGSQVHIVDKPDVSGGYLGARIDYVRALCATDDRYVWLDQYTNPGNWQAHYRTTAPAIARQFPRLDTLFVGAGTTGTLMGCAHYFREWHRPVRIIAIDSAGSVTFGDAPGRRMIPGLGTGIRPPLLRPNCVAIIWTHGQAQGSTTRAIALGVGRTQEYSECTDRTRGAHNVRVRAAGKTRAGRGQFSDRRDLHAE